MCNIGDWRGGAPPPLRTPGFPRREGVRIGRRRSGRPMRLMGLRAVYREPRTSDPHPEHRVYPYLLKDLVIERANHVWYADITYIPVRRGLLYLVAVMDWASRHVLAWRLSNTLDAGFCVEALDEALTRHGTPEIFNTDQGSQFTGFAFTGRLREAGVRISMDGRGRLPGQRLHRAAVAFAQIRGRLSARAHRRLRSPTRHRRMDRLLQHREAALGARRKNASRSLPWQAACGYGGQAAKRLAFERMRSNPTGTTSATARSIHRDSGGMNDNRECTFKSAVRLSAKSGPPYTSIIRAWEAVYDARSPFRPGARDGGIKKRTS